MAKMWFIFSSILFVAYLLTIANAQIPVNLTVSMNLSAQCASKSSFKVGDVCQVQIKIAVPAQTTSLVVNLMASPNRTSLMAQLCQPSFTVGSNFGAVTPSLTMTSKLATSQFDQAVLNFGSVTNSGASTVTADSTISIVFNVVVIENTQTNGTTIPVVGTVQHTNGQQIWVGRASLLYTTDTLAFNAAASTITDVTGSPSPTDIGRYDTLQVRLTADHWRSYGLLLTAQSLDPDITLCSILIESAGWCYSCMASANRFIASKANTASNTVTLDLGYLVNTGINVNNATGNSDIIVTIVYQVLTTATAGSSGQISVDALFKFTASASQTLQLVHVVSYTPVSPETVGYASPPTVATAYSSSVVSVLQSFSVNLVATFPSGFDNKLAVAVQANQGTTDNTYRYKICSVQIATTGINMPCLSCLNQADYFNYYSSNAAGGLYDSVVWTASNLKNFDTFSQNPFAESSSMNTISFVVTGQVLPHALNTVSSTISIPLNLTFGDGLFNYSTTATFTLGSNATASAPPQFSFYVADGKGTSATVSDTRTLYLDILTSPAAVYSPMKIQLTMPQTGTLASASICSVQLLTTGFYTSCAQKSFLNNVNNNRITYLQTLDRFKKNVATIQLDSICNSANSSANMTQADGLIRFVIYFHFEDDPSFLASRTLSALVLDQASATIYTGSLAFSVSPRSPSSNAASSVYSYTNLTGGSPISGNSFGLADAYLKIPSNTAAGYYFQAMVSQPTFGGSVSFCTMRITAQGSYVPCANPLAHFYLYSPANYQKYYDYANGGQICSANNWTTVFQAPRWDANSLDLQMIVRPSKAANGAYSLFLDVLDLTTQTSVLINSIAFNWTAVPYAGPILMPNYTVVNASAYSVNTTDPATVYFSASQSLLSVYAGQTGILRYQLVLNEPDKFYDLVLTVTSSLATDQFEIFKLFISNVGDNFPCTSYLRPVTFQNGSTYAYQASLDMGNIAYYPIDPKNISASTIIVEAFVRIPMLSALPGSTASFTFSLTRDTLPDAVLSQTVSGINIISPSGFTSHTPSGMATVGQVAFVGTGTSWPITVSSLVTLDVTFNVPPLSSLLTKITLKCVDFTSGLQFAAVQSAAILSLGRNIDGITTDWLKGVIKPVYSRTGQNTVGSAYYNDTVLIDLGILTNTMYAQKLGNYSAPADDLLTLRYQLLVIDESISAAGFQSSVSVKTDLGGSNQVTTYQNVTVSRASPDQPVLGINATILNDTSLIFDTGYVMTVRFQLGHLSNSTAEAYNVSVPFYFPPYITFESVSSCSSSSVVTTMMVDSAVYFNISRLHFGEVMTCVFTATVDKNNTYRTYVQTFGVNPPAIQKVPLMAMYQKYPRGGAVQFFSPMSFIAYKPVPVTISGIPNEPLVSRINSCQLTSSVSGSNPAYAITTAGWTSGFRSIYWYQTGATYLTVAFGNVTVVTSILLIQLSANGYTTPFSRFQISFSDDGISYAYLPEVSFPSPASGASFVYTIPNNYISCRFMRVHLTDIATPSELAAKTSGLIIGEIYGQFQTTNYSLQSTCNYTAFSAYYAPRSYLYIPEIGRLYVCDENIERTCSECYSTTDDNSTNVLVLSKIVSTVVFWVRDQDILREFVYGIGNDKVSYVRTDDYGISWKAVSPFEFETMRNASSVDSTKFISRSYSTLSVSSVPVATFGSNNQWTVGVYGVSNMGSLRIDWYT